MSTTTDKILLKLLQNIILRGHEHIIANFDNHEIVLNYMKEKQQPAINQIMEACKLHFENMQKSKISVNGQKLFLNIMKQVSEYKVMIELILQKKASLEQSIENMNAIYENLKDAMSYYQSLQPH